MTARAVVVALALLGCGVGAARAQRAVAADEWRCSYCHQPMAGTHRPGCPQGGSSSSGGGYGGSDQDAYRALGQALGEAIAHSLFGDPEQAAREAALRAQREQALALQREAEAQARRELAGRLREDWDQRDAARSRALASIFADVPAERPRHTAEAPAPAAALPLTPWTPAPEPWTDTSVVDLRGTLAGGADRPAAESAARLAALDFEAQRRRAAATEAWSLSLASSGVPPPIVSDPRSLPFVARAKEYAKDVGLDLIEPVLGAPHAILERELKIVDDVRTVLSVEHVTAIGRPGGERQVDLQLDDAQRVAALGHAADQNDLATAYQLTRDGPSAAPGLFRERLKDELSDQAAKAPRRVLFGD